MHTQDASKYIYATLECYNILKKRMLVSKSADRETLGARFTEPVPQNASKGCASALITKSVSNCAVGQIESLRLPSDCGSSDCYQTKES